MNIATIVGSNQNRHRKDGQHWAIQCIGYKSYFDVILSRLFSHDVEADFAPTMVWQYSTRIGDEVKIEADINQTAVFFERILMFLVSSKVFNNSFVIFISDDFPTISTSTEDPNEN